jgi:plastocyanin
MSNETLFYVFGIALALSAVLFSILGLKAKSFPGKAFPLVVLWFAILVGGAATFAVLHAEDEEKAKAAELEEAGEVFEAEGSQSETAPLGEEGALGGEEGEANEEAEENAEENLEPVEPKEGQAQAAGSTLQLAADPAAIAFNKTSLTSKPGKVTIDLDNPAPLEHNVAIDKDGEEIAVSETIAEGKTSVSAELEPGTYTFLCTVPGHAEAGMEGTLTVK